MQGPLQAQTVRFTQQGPTDWVVRQQALTVGIARIQQREDGLNHCEEAVAALRKSLEEFPRGQIPLQWADIQHNCSIALGRLGEQEERTEYLLEALSTVNLALEEWTYEDFPFYWAIAQTTLGWILLRLGEPETEMSASRFEAAIMACQQSLLIQRSDTTPIQWANTQNDLGAALLGLGRAKKDTTCLRMAATAFSSALEGYRAISAARYIEAVENNLRNVQVLIQDQLNDKRLTNQP